MKLHEAYTHCPRCGNELKLSNPALSTCDSCDFVNYFNPKPCTIIIVQNDQDKILLIRRNHEPSKGTWDAPGGFVEQGENFEEGALREANEEIGVVIDELEYMTSVIDSYEYRGVTYETLAVVFMAKLRGDQEITLSEENSEYKWFSKSEIPLDKIAFPSIRDVLINNL